MITDPNAFVSPALALAVLTFAVPAIRPAQAASWVTNGMMIERRADQTATLLPNGKVLVVGGSYLSLPSAELYDPATGTWTATGSMKVRRYGHTATLLPNGKVLVAGGYDSVTFGWLSSTELYDPATGSWTNTGAMTDARLYHTATLLTNGQVLVIGGQGKIRACI